MSDDEGLLYRKLVIMHIEMRIIKWVKPTDSDFSEPDFKYDHNEVESVIISEIIKNKYKFDGEYHQHGACGAPLIELSNGKSFVYTASWRHWGALMADAWNYIEHTDKYNYMDFYMMFDDIAVYPDGTSEVKPPLVIDSKVLEKLRKKNKD